MTVIFFLLPLSIAAFVLVFCVAIVHEMLFGNAPKPSAADEEVFCDPAKPNRRQVLAPASHHDAQDSSIAV